MVEKPAEYYDSLRMNQWKDLDVIGPSSRTRYRIICHLVQSHSLTDAILDVGCGSGVLLKQIKKTGHFNEIYGSDFSGEALKLADGEGINIFHADLMNISDFKGLTFSSVICSEVLEHIENDNGAIYNLYRLINPGGKIIITVPYSMKFWSPHDEFAGHVRRYEVRDLCKKLEGNGFRVLEVFIWGGGIYALYHRCLVHSDPDKLMSSTTPSKFWNILKGTAGAVLYVLFFLDDFLVFTGNGRRIFLVAERKGI